MKHAKVRTIMPQLDGSIKIKTESYHEELNSVKREIQLNILSSRATLLSDIVKCLSVLTDNQTPELTIHIKEDRDRLMIIKTWTEQKEYYGR